MILTGILIVNRIFGQASDVGQKDTTSASGVLKTFRLREERPTEAKVGFRNVKMISMTFEEFEKRFRRGSAFERYLNIFWAIGFLGFSVYVLVAMFFMPLLIFPPVFIVVLLLLYLSVSILVVQKSRYKITIWANRSSKQENIEKIKMLLAHLGKQDYELNENHASVFYEVNWWSGVSFKIHLFADTHFIAINVRNIKGLGFDFGKAKKLRDSLEVFAA